MGNAGRRRALGIVSRGIVDDLFAFRLPQHTRFRWRQAKKNVERREVIAQFANIVGNPQIARGVAEYFENPQMKRYIASFGDLTQVRNRQMKQLRPVLRSICLAELDGNHKLVIDLVHRVLDVDNHRLK